MSVAVRVVLKRPRINTNYGKFILNSCKYCWWNNSRDVYLKPLKIRKLIKFPINTEEVLKISSDFQVHYGFPQVTGCIDGTHIPIKCQKKT